MAKPVNALPEKPAAYISVSRATCVLQSGQPVARLSSLACPCTNIVRATK